MTQKATVSAIPKPTVINHDRTTPKFIGSLAKPKSKKITTKLKEPTTVISEKDEAEKYV